MSRIQPCNNTETARRQASLVELAQLLARSAARETLASSAPTPKSDIQETSDDR